MRRSGNDTRTARSALSYTGGGASASSILEAGLDLVLKQHAKRKGLIDKPHDKGRVQSESRTTRGKPHPNEEAKNRLAKKPRAISAAVKREVWIREDAWMDRFTGRGAARRTGPAS